MNRHEGLLLARCRLEYVSTSRIVNGDLVTITVKAETQSVRLKGYSTKGLRVGGTVMIVRAGAERKLYF